MVKKGRTDWFMFVIAAGLAVFGAIMVYSASAMISLRETKEQSQFAYFYKQLGFTLAGLLAMFVASRVDYHIFENKYFVFGASIFTVVLLAVVFGFPAINGARRWIRFGGFSVQPSELTKVVLPIFLAWFLTRNEDQVGDLKATVLPCVAVLALLGGLVFIEPDLGTTIVLCAIFPQFISQAELGSCTLQRSREQWRSSDSEHWSLLHGAFSASWRSWIHISMRMTRLIRSSNLCTQ
jgi:cell division protein FtsW